MEHSPTPDHDGPPLDTLGRRRVPRRRRDLPDRIPDDEAWMDDALCNTLPERWRLHLFFTSDDPFDDHTPHEERRERRLQGRVLCRACPVRDTCLEYAMRHDIRFGIWGGLTSAERARRVRAEREAGGL